MIVKTGILKLADRRTKTINPFNSTEKNSTSVKASNKNGKGDCLGSRPRHICKTKLKPKSTANASSNLIQIQIQNENENATSIWNWKLNSNLASLANSTASSNQNSNSNANPNLNSNASPNFKFKCNLPPTSKFQCKMQMHFKMQMQNANAESREAAESLFSNNVLVVWPCVAPFTHLPPLSVYTGCLDWTWTLFYFIKGVDSLRSPIGKFQYTGFHNHWFHIAPIGEIGLDFR